MCKSMEEILWSDLPNNPYFQPLQPGMLEPEGVKLRKVVKRGKPREVYVKYDRAFVRALLIKLYLRPLMFTDYNEAQRILSEAWKEYSPSRSRHRTKASLVPPDSTD